MTAVATLAGAPTYEGIDWNRIDWKKVNRNVKRLQARLVKAVEEGKWGKVKALQWLLTHSFSGKALAVRRVTENRGKRQVHSLGLAVLSSRPTMGVSSGLSRVR